MSERSNLIDKLINDFDSRAAYTRAKISVNLSSQIKALRRKHKNMNQSQLADAAGMKQSRISDMERPGKAKFTVETLIRLASAFKVGLLIKFASFSDMLEWENEYRQDLFNAIDIDKDIDFISPYLSHKPYIEKSVSFSDININKEDPTPDSIVATIPVGHTSGVHGYIYGADGNSKATNIT